MAERETLIEMSTSRKMDPLAPPDSRKLQSISLIREPSTSDTCSPINILICNLQDRQTPLRWPMTRIHTPNQRRSSLRYTYTGGR